MHLTHILPALVVLLAAAAGAYWCARRGRQQLAMAVLALAPVLAVVPHLVFGGGPVAASATAVSATTAADAAAPPVPAAGSPASVAPMSGALPGAAAAADSESVAAEQLRVAGKYAEARDAFRRVASRRPQDADAWADAADCAAAAAAGDLDAGATDLERALRADPRHPKALWLKASLELQHKRYADAAMWWERLLAALPAGSEDRRIVEANLQEARALAGTAKPPGS
jgi:cytochrome c-type biogenesis protein CcmH